jgi:putative DNA primase/helicase
VTVEELLSRLEGVRRSGSGWTAKCPAHEDRHPSLHVTQAEDRTLIHCHAGCKAEEILLALGLAWHDLYDHVTDNTGGFVAIYEYVDETGTLLFQVCRTPDKRFLQRRPDGNGGWVWKLGDAVCCTGSRSSCRRSSTATRCGSPRARRTWTRSRTPA